MKKEYEMTTVYKYIELLDKDLNDKEKEIYQATEKYLIKMRRYRANAIILENLLA